MVSKVILGPTETLVPCVPDIVPWGLERLEREAGHSPPSIDECKGCMDLHLHSSTRPHVIVLLQRGQFSFIELLVNHPSIMTGNQKQEKHISINIIP